MVMIHRCALKLNLFWLLCCMAGLAQAASLTASVDRNPVLEGESFQLVLDAQGDVSGEADLTPLQADFDVISRSTSNSVQMSNGSVTKNTALILGLMAKRSGDLVIPSIRWGSVRSKSIQLVVQRPGSSAAPNQKPDIFVDATIDRSDPWQGGQVIYTARLHVAVQLLDGSLSEPTLNGVLIESLGADKRYQQQLDGRTYQVIERRWALFPQRAGRIELPAVEFNGDITERGRQTLLFGRRKVRIAGPALTLDVQSPVANMQPWLPAWQVTMAESWSQTGELIAGEPVTRTVTLTALGLTGAQLPELAMPSSDGLKIYPDQPLVQSIPGNQMLTGRRTEKFAMVPTRPGKLTVPEIRLTWWDARHNQPREAVLPERVFNVLPATEAEPTQTVPVPDAEATTETVTLTVTDAGWWPVLAAMALVLWLLTLLLWWLWSRRDAVQADERAEAPPGLRKARRLAVDACKQHDPVQAQHAVLMLAGEIHQPAPHSLAALAGRVDDEALQAALRELDRCRYAGESAGWSGDALRELLPKLEQTKPASNRKSESALPALYPR